MVNKSIQKTTSKGQITLPKAWRGKFKTSHFALKWQDDSLTIRPVDIDQLEETIVFSAERDNQGRGLPAKDLLRIIKKIDG
ncbi:MAG: hypothetical protein WDZ85_02095 [Candidatus Paceibacterota bacterium]